MDLYRHYAVDNKLEIEGKEFDFGGGVKMLIAKSYNPSYRRMLTKLFEAHKHTIELQDTPEQVNESRDRQHKIMAEVMAHTILLGWSGPVEYDGTPLPYSTSNAQKLLMLEEFQKEVAKRADDFKNYRVQVEEADAKNSSPTSNGVSPGVAA